MSYSYIRKEDLTTSNQKSGFSVSIKRSRQNTQDKKLKQEIWEEGINEKEIEYKSIFAQNSFEKGVTPVTQTNKKANLHNFNNVCNESNPQTHSKWQPQSYFEDDKETSLLQDFWTVVKLAIPPIISMFFQFFVQLINTYYIGHLDDQVIMAGIGMGNMLINILCFAITQGLNSALETFVSQSFGAANYQYCGVLLNRGRLIVTVILIPIILLFMVSDQALIYIGQDAQIAYISKQYSLLMIPGIWAMTQFDAIRKFMIAQRQNTMPVYIQFVTMIMHFGWCHLFINVYNFGIVGAAMATNITFIVNLVLIDLFMYKSIKFQYTRAPFFNKSVFEEWREYLRIGIPGAFMLCFEWWAFEFLAIFSGYISVAALAAEVVIINIVSFIFMMPLGISFAASSLVGYYVGQGNIKKAKRFANVIMLLNVLLTIIVLAIIIVFNEGISRLFTNDQEVVEIVNRVLWIIIIYIFFDTIHGVQSGIIKGLGKQSYSSVFLLICYYCFGMPLALFFAFKIQMGVSGLWLGFTIASMILDLGFYFIINCTSWQTAGKAMRGKSEVNILSLGRGSNYTYTLPQNFSQNKIELSQKRVGTEIINSQQQNLNILSQKNTPLAIDAVEPLIQSQQRKQYIQ
eukprot:403367069